MVNNKEGGSFNPVDTETPSQEMPRTKKESSKKTSTFLIPVIITAIILLGAGSYIIFNKLSSTNPEKLYSKALALAQENKTDEALSLYQKLMEKYEDTEIGHNATRDIGRIYYFQGEYEQATPYLEKYTKIKPEIAFRENLYLGNIYFKKVDYEKALNYSAIALSLSTKPGINPTNKSLAELYFYTGEAYRNKEDYKKAIEFLNQALDIQPDNKQSNFAIGIAYYYDEEYEKAEYYLNKYLSLNPQHKTAIYIAKEKLGFIQTKKGQT